MKKKKKKPRSPIPAEDRTFYYVQLPRPDGSWMTLHKTADRNLAKSMATANKNLDGRYISKTRMEIREGAQAVDIAEDELLELSAAKQLIVERLVAAHQSAVIRWTRRKTKDILLRDVPLSLHERITAAYKDAGMKSMRDWILRLCNDNTQQHKQKRGRKEKDGHPKIKNPDNE
jgi:hypothetical protein